jgi:uncharacterized membrane protein YoaK (UPF0700 family)
VNRDAPQTALLTALGLAAGSVDAGSYLGLGHVFPANMTGNTVLLGIAVAHGSLGDASRSVVALAGFCAGVAAGGALSRQPGRWPAVALRALALEAAVLAALAVAWGLAARPEGALRLVLIAAAGICMGSQSAASRLEQAPGVATTFLTGTLTDVVMGLAGTRDRGWTTGAAVWLAYGIGAIAGGLSALLWAPAPVIVAAVLVVCVIGRTRLVPAWTGASAARPGRAQPQ